MNDDFNSPFGLSLSFRRQAQDDREYKLSMIGILAPFALSLSKGIVVSEHFDKLSANGFISRANGHRK